MKRYGWLIIFVFENLPNTGFWLGLLYYAYDWYSSLPWHLWLVFIIPPTYLIVINIRKSFLLVKSFAIESVANSNINKLSSNSSREKHIKLKESIPSASMLQSFYVYAKNYARSWAPDGILYDLTLYITASNSKSYSSATLHLASPMRGELLRTYLPKSRFSNDIVEENSIYMRKRELFPTPKIQSNKYWRKAIECSIESSVSDISKSEETRIQISTYRKFHITFYFSKGNREWSKRFQLIDNKLISSQNELPICSF